MTKRCTNSKKSSTSTRDNTNNNSIKNKSEQIFFTDDDEDGKHQTLMDTVEVDPREGFSLPQITGDDWLENTFGKLLLSLTTSRSIVSFVLLSQYLLLLASSYLRGWGVFSLVFITAIIGIISNSKYVKLSFAHSQNQVKGNEERNRVLTSMAIFSLRFFVFHECRASLLPLYLLILMSSGALSTNSWFYTLLPIWFTLAHYFYNVIECVMNEGFSFQSFNHASLFLSILIFSYYVVSTSLHLKSKLTKLEHTTKQLEDALSAKGVFLRHISHEFRSPCLSSLGSVELLRETNLTEHQRDLVETIASSDGILLNLIEDVLTLVKIEHENKLVEKKELIETSKFLRVFSLEHCVKTIGNVMKSYSTQFDVNVCVSIDDITKSIFVRANQTRIFQIIINLMTNSIKASKQRDNVELKCYTEGEEREVNGVIEQNIVFKVIDYGCGIDKSKQEKIFEPFSQLHNVNESIYPGTGLGLSTVSHNVKAMKGFITLESSLNEGSEFKVVLPLEIVKEDIKQNSVEQNDIDPSIKRQLRIQENYIKLFSMLDQSNKPKERANIIIADDNSINRKVILKLIESLGFEADAVCDGKQLVDNFNEHHHKLVITDLNMPIMNGLEAAQELRRKFKNVKIVVLTGDVLAETPSSVFDRVLVKPVHKGVLKKCIEGLLDEMESTLPNN